MHIYFDANIRHAKSQNLTIALSNLRTKLSKDEKLSSNEQKLAFRLLLIERDPQGNFISAKTNQAKVAEYLFTAGYRILLSDCVSSPKEAYRAYQMRNSIEESFGIWKQDIGRRFGTSTNSTTEGKIFNIFIAASIALMFKTHTSYCKTKGMELPFDGDKVILKKLEGIKAKIWNDGLYYTEVTGVKRELLEALDIPIPDAAVFTKAEQTSLQQDEELEDDERFISSTIDELAASLNTN